MLSIGTVAQLLLIVLLGVAPARLTEPISCGGGERRYPRLLAGGRAPLRRDYTARSRRIYQKLRDRKVALFMDRLPAGVWEIRYDLRAEVPGRFHALPVEGHAMSVPEIRGNGAASRLTVRDAVEQQ